MLRQESSLIIFKLTQYYIGKLAAYMLQAKLMNMFLRCTMMHECTHRYNTMTGGPTSKLAWAFAPGSGRL